MLLLGLSKAPMAMARRRKAAVRAAGSMREVATGDSPESEPPREEEPEEEVEEPLLAVEDTGQFLCFYRSETLSHC